MAKASSSADSAPRPDPLRSTVRPIGPQQRGRFASRVTVAGRFASPLRLGAVA